MARKRYTIDVTPLDIERARRNDSFNCVVAQAIKRTIPEADRVSVDMRTIRFSLEDRRFEYRTPVAPAQYVVDFDAGDPVEPFSFRLDTPRLYRRRSSPRKVVGVAGGRPENGGRAATEAARLPRETHPVIGHDGSVTDVEVWGTSAIPKAVRGAKVRLYGARNLRINRDRFDMDPEGANRF